MRVGKFILAVLGRKLAVPTRREWLARLADRPPVHGVEIGEALEDARHERDVKLGAAGRP